MYPLIGNSEVVEKGREQGKKKKSPKKIKGKKREENRVFHS